MDYTIPKKKGTKIIAPLVRPIITLERLESKDKIPPTSQSLKTLVPRIILQNYILSSKKLQLLSIIWYTYIKYIGFFK